MKNKADRRDMLYIDTLKTFEYIENILLDSKTRVEFSRIVKEAQEEVDYWRLGLFDIDSIVFDYAENRVKAMFEIKTREQVNYLSSYFTFRESQYLVTKYFAEVLEVPFYWLVRNRESKLWYVGDIRKLKVRILKLEGKNDNFAQFDKDSFKILSDAELKEWIIKNIL